MKSPQQAWSISVEKDTGKEIPKRKKKKTRVDTKRLEYFSDVDQLRFILKHPVLSSFLEMELNHLKTGYIIEFLLYLIFVMVIFLYFGERFTSIKHVRTLTDIEQSHFPLFYSNTKLIRVVPCKKKYT